MGSWSRAGHGAAGVGGQVGPDLEWRGDGVGPDLEWCRGLGQGQTWSSGDGGEAGLDLECQGGRVGPDTEWCGGYSGVGHGARCRAPSSPAPPIILDEQFASIL